jgi:glutamine cyclotransferase
MKILNKTRLYPLIICLLLIWCNSATTHNNKLSSNFKSRFAQKIALRVDPLQTVQTALEPTVIQENITTVAPTVAPQNNQTTDMGDYTVLKTYERQKPYYYTQGLTFASDNVLLESAGLYKESGMHFIDLNDMSLKNSYSLEGKYFGEGADYILDEFGEKQIYQLTWRERDVMIYDPVTLQRTGMLSLPAEISEGWGITKQFVEVDGVVQQQVLITDGSAKVYICDPKTLAVKNTLRITGPDNRPVKHLNELEMVNGKLWANVYLTNYIAIINLQTSKAEKMLDLTGLVDIASTNFWQQPWVPEYCLNGIAYNQTSDRLIVTGKKWTKLFEIRLNN